MSTNQKTPAKLHPSIVIVNGHVAIDQFTGHSFIECDMASASEWGAILRDISARRWAKDMGRTQRARRTYRDVLSSL
jgi:hypothetical protein